MSIGNFMVVPKIPNFTTQIFSCLAAGAGSCDTSGSLSQSTVYYLAVDEYDGYAGGFALSIDPL